MPRNRTPTTGSLWLAALVGVAALAGCMSPPGSTSDDAVGGAEASWPPMRFHFAECGSLDVIVARDRALLQSRLPEGFVAADASAFLAAAGVPLPPGSGTGLGMAAFNIVTCTEDNDAVEGPLATSNLVVLVESPRLDPAMDREPAYLDIYVETWAMDHEGWRGRFRDAGVAPGALASWGLSTQADDGVGQVAAGVVRADAHLLVEAQELQSVEQPLSGIVRHWHVGGAGVVIVDASWDAPIWAGPFTHCVLAPGSPQADLLGTTDCTTVPSFGTWGRSAVDMTLDVVESRVA